ncbi:hypothetical protein XAC40_910123 [Xanthomonas citri pv. citri]|nr:hypothetical protein XAC40_910123 [Xanthomonas citri pv. citri]CEJ47782.1 hypothetical protein XAB3213_3990028 [Xanthomonas citri pv. bilvae]
MLGAVAYTLRFACAIHAELKRA